MWFEPSQLIAREHLECHLMSFGRQVCEVERIDLVEQTLPCTKTSSCHLLLHDLCHLNDQVLIDHLNVASLGRVDY